MRYSKVPIQQHIFLQQEHRYSLGSAGPTQGHNYPQPQSQQPSARLYFSGVESEIRPNSVNPRMKLSAKMMGITSPNKDSSNQQRSSIEDKQMILSSRQHPSFISQKKSRPRETSQHSKKSSTQQQSTIYDVCAMQSLIDQERQRLQEAQQQYMAVRNVNSAHTTKSAQIRMRSQPPLGFRSVFEEEGTNQTSCSIHELTHKQAEKQNSPKQLILPGTQPQTNNIQPVVNLKKAVKLLLNRKTGQQQNNQVQSMLNSDNLLMPIANVNPQQVSQESTSQFPNQVVQKRSNLLFKKQNFSNAFSAAKRQAQLLIDRGLSNCTNNALVQSAARQILPNSMPKSQIYSNNNGNLNQKKFFVHDFYHHLEATDRETNRIDDTNGSNPNRNTASLYEKQSSLLLPSSNSKTTEGTIISDHMRSISSSTSLLAKTQLCGPSNIKLIQQNQQIEQGIGGATTLGVQIVGESQCLANSMCESQIVGENTQNHIEQTATTGLVPQWNRPVSLHQRFQQEYLKKQQQQQLINQPYTNQRLPPARQRGLSAQEAVSVKSLGKGTLILEGKGALLSPNKVFDSLQNNKIQQNSESVQVNEQIQYAQQQQYEEYLRQLKGFPGNQIFLQSSLMMLQSDRFRNIQDLKQEEQFYSCFFMSGNNSGLVRRVLMTRSNWRESSVYSCNLNFRWHPFSKGIRFENLSSHKKRIVNHFEFHSEITTKNGLIKNLSRYCSERGMNVFDITPCTFLLSMKEKFWDIDLVRFCEFFYKHLPEALQNKPEYKKNLMDIKSKFRPINIRKEPKTNSNNKKKTAAMLSINDDTMELVKSGEMKIHSTFLGENSTSYMWLLKPTNLNRGRGIELFSDLNQLETLLNNYLEGFYEQPISEKVEGKVMENNNNQIIQQNEEQRDENNEIFMKSKSSSNILDTIPVNILQMEKKQTEQDKQKAIFVEIESLKQIASSDNENNNKHHDITQKVTGNHNSSLIDDQEITLVSQSEIKARKQIDKKNPLVYSASPIKRKDLQVIQKKTQGNGVQQQYQQELINEKGQVQSKFVKNNKAIVQKVEIASSTQNNNKNINNFSSADKKRRVGVGEKTKQNGVIIGNSNSNIEPSQINGGSNGILNSQPAQRNSNGISAEFGGYLMKEHSFVIQKYIERPLLLSGRKFDIRMWVLVTGCLDVYLFKEGYIRTSSKPFDLSDTNDIFVHLTNNAIQKYSENYGQFESGNQLSLKQFDEYMQASGQSNRSFQKDIMPSIEQIVMMSLLSVGKQLNANDRKVSFELFGYDFFVDSDFKVWLIEVNTNPCIEESSPLLGMLIPRMIDDALKLTVDVLFPPVYPEGDNKMNQNINNPQKSYEDCDNCNQQNHNCNSNNISRNNTQRTSLFPVDGYSSENMFDFLINLNNHQ